MIMQKSEIKTERVSLHRFSFKTYSLAFTLAEVLITLGIIGIVAALTLPVLISKYDKMATASRLQKIYTTFNNSLSRSQIDNEHIETWNITSSNNSNGEAEFIKYFKPYLNISEYCGVSQYGVNKCWKYIPRGKDGSEQSWSGNPSTFFVLSDGTSAKFYLAYNTNSVIAAESTGYNDSPYFRMNIDINGAKLPNSYGRDIFTIDIYRKGGVQPMNSFRTGRIPNRTSLVNMCNANKASSYNDSGCLSLIMVDGWKISDDYIY